MSRLSLFRDAVRAKEIITILVRYGFADLLRELDAPAAWISKIVPSHARELTTWQRIRMAAEKLGPTFIKMGQIMSTRPDILPPDLCRELEKLRDQVEPEPFARIRKVVDTQLEGLLEDYFSEFDEQAIAGGSMAQVHRARLQGTGEYVAVKVQRPDIQKRIQSDLEILSWLAKEAHERIEELRGYDLPHVVRTLRRALREETDFRREAHNAILFNVRNPYKDRVFAPRVYEKFTTSLMIVTELVVGTPPNRLEFTVDEGHRLARAGGRSVFNQTLISGFFHADPHAGNILVTADHRICFLDWGQVGQLTRHMRYQLADLFEAVADGDPERVALIGERMSPARLLDRQELEVQITRVLDRYNIQEDEVNVGHIGRIMLELYYVFGHNGIRVTRDYTLLAKAIVSIDQVGKRLDPKFDLGEIARPFLDKLSWERWNPFKAARQSVDLVKNIAGWAFDLPHDLQRLLRRFDAEDVRINLNHTGLEPFGDDLNKVANRVSLAIIIGSIFIGSSMIITTGIKPFIWGYPALGLIGYLISFVMGIWVIFDILRHGKHR